MVYVCFKISLESLPNGGWIVLFRLFIKPTLNDSEIKILRVPISDSLKYL